MNIAHILTLSFHLQLAVDTSLKLEKVHNYVNKGFLGSNL